MKKIRLLFFALFVAALAGCTADMDKFTERLDDLEARVAALETLCAQMNEDISSMRTVISALEDGLYITDVKNVSGGYRIEFSDGETITIRHGEDGEDGVPGTPGADGQDGYTPVIGVRMDTDGIYYWTLDGEWLLDDQGNKMRVTGENGKDGADGEDGKDGEDGEDGADGAPGEPGAPGEDGADGKDGVTPVIGVAQGEDGIYYWTINGEWLLDENGNKVQAQYLGGADSEGLIEDIVVDDMGITFILSDGSELYIPLYEAITITFDAEDLLVMEPGSERDIHYTIESRLEDIRIEVLSSSDIRARVVPTDAFTGVINIRTGSSLDEYSKVVVFATNGEKMLMRTIIFEEAELYVTDASDVSIGMQGGDIQLFYMSNLECEVSISPEAQSWLSVSQTKAVEEHTLWLSVAINEGEARTGTVVVGNPDGLHITYTINQAGTVSEEQRALEREALVAIYESLEGEKWGQAYSSTWCSELPVSEWEGVGVDGDGSVVRVVIHAENTEEVSESYSLTSKVGNLRNLEYFQVDGIRRGVRLPVELFECIKLKNLTINECDGEIPEGIGNLKNLETLTLSRYLDNDYDAVLPGEIGNCRKLYYLNIENMLKGTIPPELGNCTELEYINLSNNNLSGSIPSELGNCVNAEVITLHENVLAGSVPENLGTISKLRYLTLFYNKLSGDIPGSILQNAELWSNCWGFILEGNAFNPDSYSVQGLEFTAKDIAGKTIMSSETYKNNKYTLLLQMCSIFTPVSVALEYVDIYDKYKDYGFDILSYWMTSQALTGVVGLKDQLVDIVRSADIQFTVIPITEDNDIISDRLKSSYWTFSPYYPFHSYPALTLVDENGTVVFYDFHYEPGVASRNLMNFLDANLELTNPDIYESIDYGADGVVETLQTAVIGNGIDVVLMGDAYSDRLIADGTYRSVMENTMEQFFSEEPYKSFREYFNVYMVNVVSPNEVYGTDSRTALSTWFGDGTSVGGDDQTVFSYALNAISEDRMDEALIVVMMNRDYYAGTCWMYYPESGDYGNGVSVAYFPTSSDEATFRGLILHEAGGHGFAKLADEYAYEEYGQVPSEEITNCQNLWDFGWYPNIDFTSDPALVNWSEFIADARYQYDGLGVFEGGYTYWTGVWRPTENSIMRYNEGGFNAPSREAIYTRINKLAFGESWQYDYEDFVSYDAVNRRSEPATAPSSVLQRHEPTAPPVIVRKTWREALESSGQPEAHLKSR